MIGTIKNLQGKNTSKSKVKSEYPEGNQPSNPVSTPYFGLYRIVDILLLKFIYKFCR
jgi:hypothetical protein